MEHTITLRITDEKATPLPEVDDVIAIAHKVQEECRPGDFELVFSEAMKVYALKKRLALIAEHPCVHSQE